MKFSAWKLISLDFVLIISICFVGFYLGTEFDSQQRQIFYSFPLCPDGRSGAQNLIFNGYRGYFHEDEAAGSLSCSLSCNAEVKNSGCYDSVPWAHVGVLKWACELFCLYSNIFGVKMWPHRSKAWNAFAHPNTGIVGSNSTRDIDVCGCCVFVLAYVGSGLATGWSPVQGVFWLVINSEWEQTREPKPSRWKNASA
jgi:hypothetical protein